MNLEHRDNCIIIKYIPNRDEASGVFDPDNGKIYISAGLPLLERECAYYHELTHKECLLNKCPCWEGSEYLCEYHAMRGELNRVTTRDSLSLRRAYLRGVARCLKKYAHNPKQWCSQYKALTRLMKTKAFKQLKRMA